MAEVTQSLSDSDPLESLFRDETVNVIMVNGPRQVFVERMGNIEKTNVYFQDSDHLMRVIGRLVSPLGGRLDAGSPMLEAHLGGQPTIIKAQRTKLFEIA